MHVRPAESEVMPALEPRLILVQLQKALRPPEWNRVARIPGQIPRKRDAVSLQSHRTAGVHVERRLGRPVERLVLIQAVPDHLRLARKTRGVHVRDGPEKTVVL